MSTETRRIQFDFIARDRGVSRQMEETGQAAEEMNQGLEGGAGRMGKLGAVAGKLGPILGTVAAAAAVIGPALAKGLDATAANAKFQAQLGLTAKESKRVGGVAGKLYSAAYGESMDEVRTAITAVMRNMDGMNKASSEDLKQTAARAMDLATVMDEDVSRVTAAVSQMMRAGLAKNSKEAFDVMTRGAQLGANKAEDLADTMEEYGVQFKNMGLDGKSAMGLMVQGLQAGGRNADLVADTIKEFSIEAVAGGERVSKGFKNLGLDAGEMSKAFAKGGPGAAKALDTVLDKLRAIKDPVKRNQVAIELFGTKAEDMGKALFALDPSEATKKLGKFAGATDAAGKAMGTTMKARLVGFKRTVETQVTNVAGKALDGLAKLGGEARKGFKLPATGKAANDAQRLGQAFRSVANVWERHVMPAAKGIYTWFQTKILPVIIKLHREVLKEAVKQFQKISKEIGKNEASFKGLGKIIGKIIEVVYKSLGPVLTWLYKVVLKTLGLWITASIKSYALLAKHLGVVWKSFTSGGKVISGWYKTAKSAMSSFRDLTGKVLAAVLRGFVTFATTLVKTAARAFGWVPGLGGKLKTAAREMEGFKKRANAAIDDITSKKTSSIEVKAWGTYDRSRTVRPELRHFGGPITGALIKGASRLRDSVPALLRVDEHVLTPEEVDGAGGHGAVYRMRALMKKGLLKGFDKGGAVGVNVRARTPSAGSMKNTVTTPILGGLMDLLTEIAKLVVKLYGGSTGVVAAARSMIGYPYSWGGGGKSGPSYGIGRGAGTYGFDCSGLTEYAWWKGARTSIGGTTYSQWPNSTPTQRRPGALGFPHMGHVVIASDKPGYIIQAPFTGSHVQEVARGGGYSWRWPKGAKYYEGGPVGQAAKAAFLDPARAKWAAKLGMVGDPAPAVLPRGRFDIARNVPRKALARGGFANASAPYLVGERGPEIFVPRKSSGTVHPHGATVIHIERLVCEFADDRDMYSKGREFADGLREYARRGGKIPTGRHG